MATPLMTNQRYSADTLKATSDLQLDSYQQTILKTKPPSSLDYPRTAQDMDGTLTLIFAKLETT